MIHALRVAQSKTPTFSLQSLKNNLSNVIVLGLIVAAFKKTIDFEVNNATDLLALCGSVAMLALSTWLTVRGHGTSHETQRKRLE